MVCLGAKAPAVDRWIQAKVTIGGESAPEPHAGAGGPGRGPSGRFYGPRECGSTGRPRRAPEVPPEISEESHAYSGFSPRSRPPSWAAERFVEVDNHHRHSLVALSGQDGKIVGHGYYALDKPGVAEVALPVADSMQGTRHHPASGTWQPPPRQPGSRRLRA